MEIQDVESREAAATIPPQTRSLITAVVESLRTSRSPYTSQLRSNDLAENIIRDGLDLAPIVQELRARTMWMREQDREARINGLIVDVSRARAIDSERRGAVALVPGDDYSTTEVAWAMVARAVSRRAQIREVPARVSGTVIEWTFAGLGSDFELRVKNRSVVVNAADVFEASILVHREVKSMRLREKQQAAGGNGGRP